jgi:hypothetical protein
MDDPIDETNNGNITTEGIALTKFNTRLVETSPNLEDAITAPIITASKVPIITEIRVIPRVIINSWKKAKLLTRDQRSMTTSIACGKLSLSTKIAQVSHKKTEIKVMVKALIIFDFIKCPLTLKSYS